MQLRKIIKNREHFPTTTLVKLLRRATCIIEGKRASERVTGRNRERPGPREALAAARAGDTLVVTIPDRLARTATQTSSGRVSLAHEAVGTPGPRARTSRKGPKERPVWLKTRSRSTRSPRALQ